MEAHLEVPNWEVAQAFDGTIRKMKTHERSPKGTGLNRTTRYVLRSTCTNQAAGNRRRKRMQCIPGSGHRPTGLSGLVVWESRAGCEVEILVRDDGDEVGKDGYRGLSEPNKGKKK